MNPIISNYNKIRWKFTNFKNLTENGAKSETFKFQNIDWNLKISGEKMENSDKTLAVYLEYDGANKNEKNWCCQVKAQFKIFQQNGGGNHVKREIEGFYHKDSHISRGIDILNWRDVFGGGYYINSDDAIVIEVEFSFQFYDFSRKEAGFTDFTVFVNKDKTYFFSNSGILCSKFGFIHNKVVNNLLENSPSMEFHTVNAEEFCQILMNFSPMYNTIKNDDYAKFIELAKKYKCLSLHQRCEHFLIQNQQVKLIDKFKYAQDNDYELLMVKCIDSNANQKFARRSEIRGVERCDKVENYESAFGLFLNDFE